MGFDNAFSRSAARTKGIESEVAGDADLLRVPDLNSGNLLYKSFNYMGSGNCAGLVLGALVSIVLSSRADSLAARLASVALAVLLASDSSKSRLARSRPGCPRPTVQLGACLHSCQAFDLVQLAAGHQVAGHR